MWITGIPVALFAVFALMMFIMKIIEDAGGKAGLAIPITIMLIFGGALTAYRIGRRREMNRVRAMIVYH
jgi:hypothetical protein